LHLAEGFAMQSFYQVVGEGALFPPELSGELVFVAITPIKVVVGKPDSQLVLLES
jgi:hypothetical protein